MKKLLSLIFVIMFIITISFCQEPIKSNPNEINTLKNSLKILEDTKKNEQLIKDLKQYIKAYETVGKTIEKNQPTKTNISKFTSQILKTTNILQIKISSFWSQLNHEIRKIPAQLKTISNGLASKTNKEKLSIFLFLWLIAIFIALITWRITKKLKLKFSKKLENKNNLNFLSKISNQLKIFIYKSLPLNIFYAVSITLTLIVFLPPTFKAFLFNILVALLVFHLIKQFFRTILAIDYPKLAIFKINQKPANFLNIWIGRISLFSLWSYFLYNFLFTLNQPSLTILLVTAYQIGLLILLLIMFAQIKNPIKKNLKLKINKEDNSSIKKLKTSFNTLLDKSYYLIILYFSVLFIVSVLGYTNTRNFILSSTVRSIGIILITFVIKYIWDLMFKKLFEVNDTVNKKYKTLIDQVNLYIDLISKAGYLTIFVFTFLTILDIWGVDAFGLLSKNAILIQAIIYSVLTIFAAYVIIRLSTFLMVQIEQEIIAKMSKEQKKNKSELEKRAKTLSRLIHNTFIVGVSSIAVFIVLSLMGIDIKPLLGGVGIMGLAVGFGAQSLVKDILGGLFLILENRVRVNDVAIINGTGGLVEQVNLRTTVMRSLDGSVHVFPNGSIDTLANLTHEFSCYVFDIGVAYKEDVDKVIEVLKNIGKEMREDEIFGPLILADFEVWGLDKFGDSALVIKARIKTQTLQQWAVGREFNRRIKIKFDELGIEIPFPHQTLYFGEASPPIDINVKGDGHFLKHGNNQDLSGLNSKNTV